MIETAHTHYCGSCEREVDCHVARRGGCIFPATSAMTCEPCAERATAVRAAVAAALATEREACVRLAEARAESYRQSGKDAAAEACFRIAAAIRSRT